MKTKDEMLQAFEHFHAFVERETGEKLKCVRIDNRGEYCGPFDEFAEIMTFDIKIHLIRPHS